MRRQSLRPLCVINAAPCRGVNKAEGEADVAKAINASGVARISDAFANAGIPLIHLSTDYVFDGSGSAPYSEEDPGAPPGVHGRLKLVGGQAVTANLNEYVILRTGWFISPYGRNFAKMMLRLAARRDELNVVDDKHGHQHTHSVSPEYSLRSQPNRQLAQGRHPMRHLYATGTESRTGAVSRGRYSKLQTGLAANPPFSTLSQRQAIPHRPRVGRIRGSLATRSTGHLASFCRIRQTAFLPALKRSPRQRLRGQLDRREQDS